MIRSPMPAWVTWAAVGFGLMVLALALAVQADQRDACRARGGEYHAYPRSFSGLCVKPDAVVRL